MFIDSASPEISSPDSTHGLENGSLPVDLPPFQHAGESAVSNDAQCALLRSVACDQDRSAFSVLAHLYLHRVQVWGLYRGLGLASAEALAQETLVNVWRRADELFLRLRETRTWTWFASRVLRHGTRAAHPTFPGMKPASAPSAPHRSVHGSGMQ